jgi:hypothetical protein
MVGSDLGKFRPIRPEADPDSVNSDPNYGIIWTFKDFKTVSTFFIDIFLSFLSLNV